MCMCFYSIHICIFVSVYYDIDLHIFYDVCVYSATHTSGFYDTNVPVCCGRLMRVFYVTARHVFIVHMFL